MQKIYIKKETKQLANKKLDYYIVPALALKNNNENIKLLIPHPAGNTTMSFEDLDSAISSIKKAGFDYVISEDGVENNNNIERVSTNTNKLETQLFNLYCEKIKKNQNSNVVIAALTSLSDLNNIDSINIFIDKLGEDNETIRNIAIQSLVKFKNIIVDPLIEILTDENWVKRNSAITCLTKLAEFEDIDKIKIIIPIINRMEDTNPIVQTNAILATGKIFSIMKSSIKLD